jgi:trimeric autotransporter adhesin
MRRMLVGIAPVFASFAATILIIGLLAGCSGGGGDKHKNPIPVLTALSPTTATAGGPAFTLTVTGSGYVSGSVVLWNGAARPTTYVSRTQISAAIAASDIASAGTAQVSVRNPSPGGGTSGLVTMPINAVNPAAPALTSIEPSTIASGSPALSLTMRGSNFVAGSVARWNGQTLATTFVSATEVKAAVPAEKLLTLGDVPIDVSNPVPDAGVSGSLPLHIGGILRVSVSHDGSDVDGGSDVSSVSADGRFVAFASNASNLVAGDSNGVFDVFVRDTCLNAPVDCTPTTRRVSVASDGSQGDAGSGWTQNAPELSVAISGSGRYVAFVSAASNLVPGDTNTWDDVFVRDTCLGAAAGCVPKTTLVSVGMGGATSNSHSTHVAVGRSGRFVAFISYANNLVAGDTNGALDVFVRDTCAGVAVGCVPTTSRASVSDAGVEADRDSLHPSFSGDERYISFASSATNLVAGDTNDALDAFRRDTCFGAAAGCVPGTVRVSLTNGGLQSTGGGFFPKVSLTGRYVSFVSTAADLVSGDTNTVDDLFLRDTCLGAPAGCAPSTIRLSMSNSGMQAGGIWMPAMSDDARFAAFASSDGGYVAGDSNGNWDVFLRDSCTGVSSGCTLSTRRLSVAFDGTEGDSQSQTPAVSADGRFVTFSSSSSNLVPGGVSPSFYMNIYVTEASP